MMSAVIFVALLFAFSPISNAQGDQTLPTCANSCVEGFTSGNEIGGCSALDIGCICNNSSFLDDIACCLAESCSEADQEQAVKYAQQLCGSAGVNVPDKVVCSTIDQSSSSTTSRTTESSTTSQEPETTEDNESSTTITLETSLETSLETTISSSTESSTDISVSDETSASSAPTESSDTSDSSSGSGGLSLGAKIGLGVGLPLAAIIACLLLWLFCIRRRRQSNSGSQGHGAAATPASPWTGPYEADGSGIKPEIDSVDHRRPYELSNTPMRQTTVSRRQGPPIVSHTGHELSATPIVSAAYPDQSGSPPHLNTDPHLPEMQSNSSPSRGYELAAASISGSTAHARSEAATSRSDPHGPAAQATGPVNAEDSMAGEGVSEREALHRRQMEIMRERERLTRLSRLDEEEREIQARLQRLGKQKPE